MRVGASLFGATRYGERFPVSVRGYPQFSAHIGPGLCTILDMDFREFFFPDVG
jgi:hypothetical protein